MKKLSLLCILAILCASLASCDEAIVVNPGSTTGASDFTSAQTGEATQAPQTANHFTTPALITEITEPIREKTNIYYDSFKHDEGDNWAGPSVRTIEYILNTVWEEDGLPIALCKITVRDIDYSQITEEMQEIPIVVTIDKIIEKNSFFTEKEGASVSAINYYCDWYKRGDTVAVRFVDHIFPVAEVGEEYLAVLLMDHENTGDAYNMGGISVPLPKTAPNDAYFDEQLQRLGMGSYVKKDYLQPILDRWFYPYIEAE